MWWPWCRRWLRHGLLEAHKAGIHKTHHHHSGGTRTLDKGCNSDTCQHTGDTVLGHYAQNIAESVARNFLQPLAHHLHSIEEKTDGTKETEEVNYAVIHWSEPWESKDYHPPQPDIGDTTAGIFCKDTIFSAISQKFQHKQNQIPPAISVPKATENLFYGISFALFLRDISGSYFFHLFRLSHFSGT